MMMLTMTKQSRRSRSRRRRRDPWAAFSMSKCSQGWHQPPPQPSFQAEDDDVMFQGTCLVAVAVYFGDDEYANNGDDNDIGNGDDVFSSYCKMLGVCRLLKDK